MTRFGRRDESLPDLIAEAGLAALADAGIERPDALVVAAMNPEEFTGAGNYFANAVTEIVAGEGAHVDHAKIERDSGEAFHVGTVQVHQERSSSVTSRNISIGGALIRNEFTGACWW